MNNRWNTMAKNGWSRPFEDPITLPDGRKLVTLKNATDYIVELPKAEQTRGLHGFEHILVSKSRSRFPAAPHTGLM
jgi:hypothetical protein